jgi:uncharacterized membrane protein YbhN (UPF0104 family)
MHQDHPRRLPRHSQSTLLYSLAVLKNKKVQSFLQLVLSLALLAWLISQVGPTTILDTLTGLDWGWYLPAFLLFQLNMIIRAYRWYLLLSALDKRPPFLHLVYLYYLGFFFNNFIPSGFGGDVVKVLGLRQQYGRGTEALSSVLMDRFTGLLGSSLVALAALAWSGGSSQWNLIDLPPLLIAVILAISAGIPAGFLLLRFTNPLDLVGSLLPPARLVTDHVKVRNLAGTIQRYPPSALSKSLLTSLPFTLVLILTQYFIALSLSIDIPFALFALFVPLISLVNLIPVSFNGLGTREGAYLLLFGPAGVPPGQAISLSLALYVIRVCTGLGGGLLYLLRTGSRVIHFPNTDVA